MVESFPPSQQGLYHPHNEHDACGVGFVAHIKGRKSHEIVAQGLQILRNLTHRGATGADPLAGDGAGILLQLPDAFFREELKSRGIVFQVLPWECSDQRAYEQLLALGAASFATDYPEVTLAAVKHFREKQGGK